MKIEDRLLVKCGYAERFYPVKQSLFPVMLVIDDKHKVGEPCQPYTDSLEGYRQLFALATYFASIDCIIDSHGITLWLQSEGIDYPECEDADEYKYFAARVKWCCETTQSP